jgi:hypothetical protein
MSTRIFSASLFCVALLGSTLPAAAATIRPEIAQPLNEAVQLSHTLHPDKVAIVEKWKAAQAVPGKTREEQRAMSQAKNRIALNGVVVGQQPDNFNPMADLAPGDSPPGVPVWMTN